MRAMGKQALEEDRAEIMTTWPAQSHWPGAGCGAASCRDPVPFPPRIPAFPPFGGGGRRWVLALSVVLCVALGLGVLAARPSVLPLVNSRRRRPASMREKEAAIHGGRDSSHPWHNLVDNLWITC